MTVSLDQSARRFLVQISGNLESALTTAAKELAHQANSDVADARYVELALQKIAGENGSLSQVLLQSGSDGSARRVAG